MNFVVMPLLIVAMGGFILGLRLMSRTSTARIGNLVSAAGMTAAILGAIYNYMSLRYSAPMLMWTLGAIGVGAVIGVPAMLVKMTAMPEMVALLWLC